jgi:hypothetical protein
LRTSIRTCENYIKIYVRKVEWGGMDWIDLIQDTGQWPTLMNMVTKLVVLQNIGKFISSVASCDFSRIQLYGVSSLH